MSNQDDEMKELKDAIMLLRFHGAKLRILVDIALQKSEKLKRQFFKNRFSALLEPSFKLELDFIVTEVERYYEMNPQNLMRLAAVFEVAAACTNLLKSIERIRMELNRQVTRDIRTMVQLPKRIRRDQRAREIEEEREFYIDVRRLAAAPTEPKLIELWKYLAEKHGSELDEILESRRGRD